MKVSLATDVNHYRSVAPVNLCYIIDKTASHSDQMCYSHDPMLTHSTNILLCMAALIVITMFCIYILL